MNGGLGNDNYVVDNVGDVVLETSILGGTDQVESTVSFTLGSNIENLYLFGASAISGTGNAWPTPSSATAPPISSAALPMTTI